MEYYREEETGRLIQEWLRWAGDGLNTPQSKLGKEYWEGEEYWIGVPVIAAQAQFTYSTMRALASPERRILILYHWRGNSLREIARDMRCHHRWVPAKLHRAHDSFWTVFEPIRKKGKALQAVLARDGL